MILFFAFLNLLILAPSTVLAQSAAAPVQTTVPSVSLPPSLPADVTIDYSRTTITASTSTQVVISTVIRKYEGIPKRVGLILQIHAINNKKLSLIDQVLVSTVELGEEQRVQFVYDIPSFIGDGQYLASFMVVDADSGAPYVMFLPIKEFVIKNQGSSVNSLNVSLCRLTITQDPTKRSYGLFEGPDIASDENLVLTCATGGTNLSGTYTVHFKNVLRNFGSNSTDEPFSTKTVEVKDNLFSFEIEHGATPQAYDYVFFLTKGEERATPYMQAHYVLQGDTATIHNVDYRRATETNNYIVEASLTGAATNFPGARAEKRDVVVDVLLTLRDSETGALVTQESNSITLVGGLQKVAFSLPAKNLSKDEYKGTLRVVSKASGKELAQKEFTFQKLESQQLNTPINYFVAIAVICGLLIGLLFLLRERGILSLRALWIMVIVLILFGLLFGWFHFTQKAEAAFTNCASAVNVEVVSGDGEGGSYSYTTTNPIPCVSKTINNDSTTQTTYDKLTTYYGGVSGVVQETIAQDSAENYYFYANGNTWSWWSDCGNWFAGNTMQSGTMSAKQTLYLNGTYVGDSTVEGSGWISFARYAFLDSDFSAGTNIVSSEWDYYGTGSLPDGVIDAVHIFSVLPKTIQASCATGYTVGVPGGANACASRLTFWADSYSLTYNAATTLNWNMPTGDVNINNPGFSNPGYSLSRGGWVSLPETAQIQSCMASGDWSGDRYDDNKGGIGTQYGWWSSYGGYHWFAREEVVGTGGLTSTKTYNLTCTVNYIDGTQGVATKSVTVEVAPAPAPTATLTPADQTIPSGGSASFSITSANSNRCIAGYHDYSKPSTWTIVKDTNTDPSFISSASFSSPSISQANNHHTTPNSNIMYLKCTNGTVATDWISASITVAVAPDLTAGTVTPATATAGIPVTLSADITISTINTNATFSNIFRFADNINGLNAQTPVAGSSITGLDVGTLKTTTRSWTPSTAGTYYVQACADNTTAWASAVAESNEDNNCSPSWTTVTVAPATCTATTINNCSLSQTTSPGSSGSCISGYSGSCNYSCFNGTWSQTSNSCVVIPPAPTANLWADPDPIDSGQFTKLKWSSINTTSCTSADTSVGGFTTGGATSTNPPGGFETKILNTDTSYAITCTGPGGPVNANTTVTVKQPNATITANPTRVTSGSTSTITWNASGVTSCQVRGPNGFSYNTLSNPIPAPTPTITTQSVYTITCQTNSTPKTSSVTVNVIPVFQEF